MSDNYCKLLLREKHDQLVTTRESTLAIKSLTGLSLEVILQCVPI